MSDAAIASSRVLPLSTLGQIHVWKSLISMHLHPSAHEWFSWPQPRKHEVRMRGGSVKPFRKKRMELFYMFCIFNTAGQKGKGDNLKEIILKIEFF